MDEASGREAPQESLLNECENAFVGVLCTVGNCTLRTRMWGAVVADVEAGPLTPVMRREQAARRGGGRYNIYIFFAVRDSLAKAC